MARAGVTREQVFGTAEALMHEGQNPTVVAVRTRLGGGSPNTIAPLLSEWKALHETRQAAGLPPVPEPVEAVLRQVWGVAWKEAQGQMGTERAALGKLREEIAKERTEMLAEIARLDAELEALKETAAQREQDLEEARRALERAESQAREAEALAGERDKRSAALEAELAEARSRTRAQEEALTALRVEAARSEERAAHVDELRAVLKTLQEQQDTGNPKRRTRPEG